MNSFGIRGIILQNKMRDRAENADRRNVSDI